MPHFILEYSANLTEDVLSLDRLFANLHTAAVHSGLFPLAGIRSRAHRCDDYRIADGNTDYAFVHLQVKIGSGRSTEEKSAVAQKFFAIVRDHLQPLYDTRGFALSFEMSELPTDLKYNHNNLREYLRD